MCWRLWVLHTVLLAVGALSQGNDLYSESGNCLYGIVGVEKLLQIASCLPGGFYKYPDAVRGMTCVFMTRFRMSYCQPSPSLRAYYVCETGDGDNLRYCRGGSVALSSVVDVVPSEDDTTPTLQTEQTYMSSNDSLTVGILYNESTLTNTSFFTGHDYATSIDLSAETTTATMQSLTLGNLFDNSSSDLLVPFVISKCTDIPVNISNVVVSLAYKGRCSRLTISDV